MHKSVFILISAKYPLVEISIGGAAMDELIKAEFDHLKEKDKEQDRKLEKLESITTSIHELSLQMKQMLEEMNKQGKRLDNLEHVPIDTAIGAKRTAINTLIGVIVGAIAVGIAQLMVQYM